jgi:hypothetical protein
MHFLLLLSTRYLQGSRCSGLVIDYTGRSNPTSGHPITDSTCDEKGGCFRVLIPLRYEQDLGSVFGHPP